MCQQTIITLRGDVLTGELVEHCGSGVVGIDVDGRRHYGRKVADGPAVHATEGRVTLTAGGKGWARE